MSPKRQKGNQQQVKGEQHPRQDGGKGDEEVDDKEGGEDQTALPCMESVHQSPSIIANLSAYPAL